MDKKPHPDDFGMSLVQTNGAQRAMVKKMRAKLAGGSEFNLHVVQERRLAVHKHAFGWASKMGVAAILILANLAYLGYKSDTVAKQAVKRAQMLPSPKTELSENDQALYWTYALYDYHRLKSQFGASGSSVVDEKLAWARLTELLPKVDTRTRFIIDGYLPPNKRNP